MLPLFLKPIIILNPLLFIIYIDTYILCIDSIALHVSKYIGVNTWRASVCPFLSKSDPFFFTVSIFPKNETIRKLTRWGTRLSSSSVLRSSKNNNVFCYSLFVKINPDNFNGRKNWSTTLSCDLLTLSFLNCFVNCNCNGSCFKQDNKKNRERDT